MVALPQIRCQLHDHAKQYDNDEACHNKRNGGKLHGNISRNGYGNAIIGRYGGCFEEDIRRFMCDRAYHITGFGCTGEVCTNSRGENWVIGVDKPIADPAGVINDFQVRIQLPRTAGGLATSGNYRNFKVVNGKKIAHTIDPHTGYPIQTDVLSATIIAPTCMLADGLATACMTRTAADVPALIQNFPGVEYMLILGDEKTGFRTVMSPGFERLILPD